MYYEKQNVVSDEKEKIYFAQGYLKDTAQHLFIAQYLYIENFLIDHTQRIDILKQFFAVLLLRFWWHQSPRVYKDWVAVNCSDPQRLSANLLCTWPLNSARPVISWVWSISEY